MNTPQTFEQAFYAEEQRVQSITERQGAERAKEFANQTLCIYHEAVSTKKHFASSLTYRQAYIGSIHYLERFLDGI